MTPRGSWRTWLTAAGIGTGGGGWQQRPPQRWHCQQSGGGGVGPPPDGSPLAGTGRAAALSSSVPSTPPTPPKASAGSPSLLKPTGRSPWTGSPGTAPRLGGSPCLPDGVLGGAAPRPTPGRLTPCPSPQGLRWWGVRRLLLRLPGHRGHGHLAAGRAQQSPQLHPERPRRQLQRRGEVPGERAGLWGPLGLCRVPSWTLGLLHGALVPIARLPGASGPSWSGR